MSTHLNGCYCQPCRDYHNKATKRYYLRQRERARGITFDIDLVPADATRDALRQARADGKTFPEIERLTGVKKEVAMPIARGKRKKVQRKTEKRVLAGLADPTLRSVAPNTLVPIRDERETVRRLIAQGWTTHHLMQILRQNGKGTGAIVSSLQRGKTGTAKYSSLEQVHWLANVIGNKLGPSKRSMVHMQHKGVFPLRHYDAWGRLIVRSLSDEQRQWVRS